MIIVNKPLTIFLFFQNSRHKTYGFDLMTEDDKVFYPLAADSEAEMEEWTAILTRAIASEMDDTDGEGRREKSGWYFNGDKD